MAMIQCPECNQPLSDQAYTCPHCGYPIKKDKYQLTRYTTPSCPGATFVRVMGILDIIGGVICAILFSFQEKVVKYYYSFSTKTYFDLSTFFTVLACCVLSSIFFFILANVIERVHDTYEIVSTLNISKDCINAQLDYAPGKQLQTKNASTATRSWTCKKCGCSNIQENYFCKGCGGPRNSTTEKSQATNAQPVQIKTISTASYPAAQENSPRRSSAQHWRCPECGTENSLDTEKCTRCGYAE